MKMDIQIKGTTAQLASYSNRAFVENECSDKWLQYGIVDDISMNNNIDIRDHMDIDVHIKKTLRRIAKVEKKTFAKTELNIASLKYNVILTLAGLGFAAQDTSSDEPSWVATEQLIALDSRKAGDEVISVKLLKWLHSRGGPVMSPSLKIIVEDAIKFSRARETSVPTPFDAKIGLLLMLAGTGLIRLFSEPDIDGVIWVPSLELLRKSVQPEWEQCFIPLPYRLESESGSSIPSTRERLALAT